MLSPIPIRKDNCQMYLNVKLNNNYMEELLDSLETSDSTTSYQNTDNIDVINGTTPDTSVNVSESVSNNNLEQSSFADGLSGGGQILPSVDGGIMNPSQSIDFPVTSSSYDQFLQDHTESVIESTIAAQSVDPNLYTTPILEENAVNSELQTSPNNDLVNTPTIDSLDIPKEDLEMLQSKADGIERSEHTGEPSFTGKACPTSHGCSGATSCDLSYGDYPY